MSFQENEGKVNDIWRRIGKTLRSGAETIVQETKELTRLGRLKLELISLENERGKAFEEAGQLAHTLYKNGNELPEEMKEIFMTIDEVEKRIDTKRKELERIRAEDVSQCVDELEQEVDDVTVLVCRQCENEVTQEDIFCSRCGSHLK